MVFVQDGAFKIATNAPAGATYWGVTNSNPNTVWNKFKGSFLYREYDANGFRQNLGFILANNYFRGGTNWLHVGINQNGFYAQRELADFFINELFAAELETDIEHTYEIMLSSDKLWARVAGNYYFVQDDALTNYTSFPVVIYEHNMKMTNRPAQYFGEWLSAAAGQFESPIVNMTKPFSYSSNSTAISSISFSDGSEQTTAYTGSGGSGTNNPILLSGPTLAIIADQTARIQWATNQSFAFTITGTSNQSTIARMNFENLSTNTIYASNTFGLYAQRDGLNVTAFPIPPLSILGLTAELDRSNRWVTAMDVAEYALDFSNGTKATNHTTKTITYTAPASGGSASFNETNVTVSTTNEIVIDVAAFDIVKIKLLTNLNVLTFSNVSTMGKRAQVYFQQDTNGSRQVLENKVAGGLIQTNANLQPTQTANALDMLEIMPGFFSSNAVAWWPQNFQPRVAFTNSLAGESDITKVGFSTNSFNATSTVLDLPSGVQAGDFLLAVIASETALAVNSLPPGTWTLSESNQLAAAGFKAYWAIADGGEDPTLTFGFTASEAGASMLLAFRGANATTPFDTDAVSTQTPGAPGTATTPAITPSVNNAMLIGVIWKDATATPIISEVSGFPLVGTSVNNADGVLAVATRLQTTATSEGVQIDQDEGGTWGIYTIAIKK